MHAMKRGLRVRRWAFVAFVMLLTSLTALANGCGTGPEGAEPTGTVRQRLEALDLAIVSISVGPRVLPAGNLPVSITVKNAGTNPWAKANVQLAFQGEGTWTNANLALPNDIAPNANV